MPLVDDRERIPLRPSSCSAGVVEIRSVIVFPGTDHSRLLPIFAVVVPTTANWFAEIVPGTPPFHIVPGRDSAVVIEKILWTKKTINKATTTAMVPTIIFSIFWFIKTPRSAYIDELNLL